MNLKKHLVAAIRGGARNLGYDITPVWKLENRSLVEHLRRLFEFYEIDCVFDVGANLGQYCDLLRDEVGFDGFVFSFEPVSKYARQIEERAAKYENWHVFDFALGRSDTSQQIHVTSSPGLNSFLQPKNDDLIEGSERVNVRTLESVYCSLKKQFGFTAPYLKCDTQGYDLEVLGGGKRIISNFRALQTEAAIKRGYEGMVDYSETIDRFSNAGFDISGMFPVFHDKALRLSEFDCVMVNSALAEKMA